MGGAIPFLDTLIERKQDGSVKLRVYRKKTHTNQYLSVKSHHPLHQKLGVVRTLLDRCEELVTEERDRQDEKDTIRSALEICGYPSWSVDKVASKMAEKKGKGSRKKKSGQKEKDKNKGMVVMPYISGILEKLARIFKKRRVSTAMKPHTTLKHLLVHPKNKTDPKEGVYKIDCSNCPKVYVGETKRPLSIRVGEHQKEVEDVEENMVYTRSRKKTQWLRHTSLLSQTMWQGITIKSSGTRLRWWIEIGIG